MGRSGTGILRGATGRTPHPGCSRPGYDKTMPVSTVQSVDDYLAHSYQPDREYIEGAVVERSVGERDHSELQTELATYLNARRRQFGIRVFVEQRIQIAPTRYRIPDICVVLGSRPTELVFTSPPLICMEVLSKDDRVEDVRRRINDYLGFGVGYVWVIDPRSRRAWAHTAAGSREVEDGVLRTEIEKIEIPLPAIFASLEE